MNRILSVFAVLLLSIAGAWADDYDPQNPPDPNISFKLTVSASPSEAGYVSGGGRYKEGQQVQLSTSPKANYDFLYWTCDGVQVSDQASFSYTMPQKPVNLVAVYAFNPTNPDDPPTSQTDIDNPVAAKGDVDGDGSITAQDASLVLQLVAGKITPSTAGVAYGAADVDGDGDVTAQDASLILQHVAGKITIGN